MKIFYVPIEPYETRYTADWISQFEDEFTNNGIDYVTVLGNAVSSTVTDGGVLDACGTHIYKFSQLTKIVNLIQTGNISDGDVIFFADLWFPGIESLFYIRNMLNIEFKIEGIFHAGTYDQFDFTCRNGMRSWGKWLEAGWFCGIDKIFVATDFHKQLLLQNSISIRDLEKKIFVTGLPFYAKTLREKYYNSNKENIVVFPHRMDSEKHPEMFSGLVDDLRKAGISFIPMCTIIETKSRQEYFNILGRSKVMVSFADQETFGYSTLESMALGNVVIVPNKLSYCETVPSVFRYDSVSEVKDRVIDALVNYKEPEYKNIETWENSIKRMIELM